MSPPSEGMLSDFRRDQISPGCALVPQLSLACPLPWGSCPGVGMSERGLPRASTINARQREKRETHVLSLEQLREREGQNHLPGSDLFARLQC